MRYYHYYTRLLIDKSIPWKSKTSANNAKLAHATVFKSPSLAYRQLNDEIK
jgi:hypothetical protein